MKYSFCSLALSALLGVTSAAHASPITYNLNGVVTSLGYAVTGTIIIDNSTGVITGGTMIENGNIFYETVVSNTTPDDAEFSALNNSNFYLLVDTETPGAPILCTTVTSPLCAATSHIKAYVGLPSDPQIDPLVSGTLSQVPSSSVNPAPSPEPSSLILLGTGMLGAASMARRRFVKA